MKKTAVFFMLCILSFFGLRAQIKPPYPLPLYIINGKQVDPASFLSLDPRDIQNISIQKTGKSTKYGSQATKSDIVDITLNKNARLVSMPELLHLFHIQDKALAFPAILSFGFAGDQLRIQAPDSFFASESMIVSVGIKRPEQVFISSQLTWGMMNRNSTKWDPVVDSLVGLFRVEADKNKPKNIIIGP